jgi:acyl carrier protein
MEIGKFIEKFAKQFDEVDAKDLSPTTNFRDLNDWSSIIALSIIAMVDEEYGVVLKGEDIRNSKTIEDLFKIVESRL